jgi:hypothetical protein
MMCFKVCACVFLSDSFLLFITVWSDCVHMYSSGLVAEFVSGTNSKLAPEGLLTAMPDNCMEGKLRD